jgi:hypothetical protein
MPSLPEIISYVQSITYETALLGLFFTAGLLLLARDWRVLIMTLLAQYILVGIILVRLVRPDIAVLKVLIGAFICPILFLSARQVSGRLADSPLTAMSSVRRWRDLRLAWLGQDSTWQVSSLVFRLFGALLVLLVAMTLGNTFPLPEPVGSITTAVYWLGLAGVLALVLTEEPLRAGVGLLTVFTGFDLFYASAEHSLLLTGLWGTVNLLIALAIGYLMVVKGTGGLEEES